MSGEAEVKVDIVEDHDEKREMGETDKMEKKNATPALVIFFAEMLGTAMLMFLGCMGCVVQMVPFTVLPHFPGICFGLTVLIVIQTIGHISGAHLNPQVTIGAYILGKIEAYLILVYFLAEFLGAILGLGLLKILTPMEYQEGMCNTNPQELLSIEQALGVEVVITAILLLVCGAVWDPRNADKADSTPIRFGFIIACLSMVAGPYTGASMNTARSFAPALFSGNWSTHWIYWVGPTIGSFIGASIYRFILSVPKEKSD